MTDAISTSNSAALRGAVRVVGGSNDRVRSFKPYPAYGDSGTEWVREIPAQWEMRRLRHVLHRIEQGWSPECDNREAADDEWGVLKAGCVNRGLFVESEHKALPTNLPPPADLEIREGDVLMSRASGSRDLVGSVAVVGKCRPRLLLCDKVFRLHVDADTAERGFVAYALNSRLGRAQIEIALSGGSGLANNIAQEVVKDLLLTGPELDEQRLIVAFLDRETAKIDALVAKKERLIELLQEKRAALITRAVTKGLDPEVRMKPSGIDWLGKLPSHWRVSVLKRLWRSCDYGLSESLAGDGDVRVLTMAHIQDGEVSLPEKGSLIDVAENLLVVANDLLFNRTNSRELVGKVGIFRGSKGDRVSFASYLVRIRPKSEVDAEFLNYLLNSDGLLGFGRSLALLSVNQANLNPTRYGEIVVPHPPMTEQAEIAAHCRRIAGRTTGLADKVRDAIERLSCARR